MNRMKRYSVYRRGNDEPLIVHGTARECARAMGVSYSSFRTMLSFQTHGSPHTSRKWEIFLDEGVDEDGG